ncbi:MAG TPA: hypothetical protein PKD83_07810 [Ignavibacteria bacterium]|nr:hypothetical protein [Ignavibacteria bacterium]
MKALKKVFYVFTVLTVLLFFIYSVEGTKGKPFIIISHSGQNLELFVENNINTDEYKSLILRSAFKRYMNRGIAGMLQD